MICSASICRVCPGWRLLNFTLLLLLTGCGRTPADHLTDYRQRVARVLEAELPDVRAQPLRVARLAVAHNALPLPQADISLLDLLRLDQCRIGQAVAQKNSTLGKVAAASQRLSQELIILRDGPACVAQLQDKDPELAAELAAAWQAKQQARLNYWWNAWLSGQEWQHFVASAARPLDWDDAAPAHISLSLTALDYALQQGQQMAAGDYHPAPEMELQLQQLLLGETLGRWLASQYLLTATLNEVAALLEQRLQQRPLCPAGRPTPQAQILNNVFYKIYAGRVQPYLSLTDRLGKRLLPRIRRMAALPTDGPPAAFRQWLAQVEQAQQQFKVANQRHVQAWQAVLRQCGLMPGSAAVTPPQTDGS